jgi:hypothetical protein
MPHDTQRVEQEAPKGMALGTFAAILMAAYSELEIN